MELRRLSVCLALCLLAAFFQCSETRHSVHRRNAGEDVNFEDEMLDDEAMDDDTQNDEEQNSSDDDVASNATILTKPATYTVTVGRTVRLECKVSDSEAVVSWEKDDKQFIMDMAQLAAPERFRIEKGTKNLLITDAQTVDDGRYRCKILTTENQSVEHRVFVFESPRIIRLEASNNGRVFEGHELSLTCVVNGTPTPQIVWSRDGPDGNYRLQETHGEFTGNSFRIRNATKEHSGKYYCYAFNKIGHSQAEVTVRVFGPPHVHVHKTLVNSAINKETVLQCSALHHNEPPLHFLWYKGGRLIENSFTQYVVSTRGAQSNLTVTPTSDQDFGTFTCVAENEFGKHNKSIELVESPIIENLDVDGPKLTWNVHSHQPLEQIQVQLKEVNGEEWKTLEVPLPERPSNEYEIIYLLEDKELQPGKYEAAIKVKNNHSWSGTIDPVIVDIEVQPQLIQHASVYRGGNGAYIIRPTTTAVLSTILMYLLVRML